MNEYTVLIERDEDNWLVGRVIELPGCHTQAKNIDELMNRIKEAIVGYLEAQENIEERVQFIGIQRIAV